MLEQYGIGDAPTMPWDFAPRVSSAYSNGKSVVHAKQGILTISNRTVELAMYKNILLSIR